MSEMSGRRGKVSPTKTPGKQNTTAKVHAKNRKRAGKRSAKATKAAAPISNGARRPVETPPARETAAPSMAGGEATASAAAAAMPAAMPSVNPPGTFATVLWTVALIAVTVGAAYATQPFWFPQLAESLRAAVDDPRVVGIDDRLTALENTALTGADAGEAIQDLEAERARFTERLKVLIERIDALEKTSQSIRKMVLATVPPADAQRAEEALRELSKRLSDLEQDGQEIEPLAQRVARLEEDDVTVVKRETDLRELEVRSEQLKGLVAGLGARFV